MKTIQLSKTMLTTFLLMLAFHGLCQTNEDQATWFADKVFLVDSIYNSLDRSYQMQFRNDGNLVMSYKGHLLFNTNTAALNAKKCMFKQDSGLLIYDIRGKVIWQAIKKPKGQYLLMIHRDGNLQLFKSVRAGPPDYRLFIDPRPEWVSNPRPIPFIAYGKDCGCDTRGHDAILINESDLKFELKFSQTGYAGVDPTYTTIILNPRTHFYIGCTQHDCTPLAPYGFPQQFAIVAYTIKD